MSPQARRPSWIVPGIIIAGVLLMIGAIQAGNTGLVIITLLVVAVGLDAAKRGNR